MDKNSLIKLAEKINDYWIGQNPDVGDCAWERAAYFLGDIAAYEITGKKEYLDYAIEWANKNEWNFYRDRTGRFYSLDNYMTCADYLLCGETYIELMDKYGVEGTDKYMIEDLEKTLNDPKNDYWWWVDTMHMALNFYNIMGKRQNDMRYADKVYKLYYNSKVERTCYDEIEHLWFRDENFLPDKMLTKNGKKVFWSRGNGWVFAGLARTLENMSKEHKYYNEYKKVFKDMAYAIKNTQCDDGFWRTSLIDPDEFPDAETSGTVLFVLGYLKGIKSGILPKEEFWSTAINGYNALINNALTKEGRICRVQGVNDRPGKVDENNTNDYAVGAILQIIRELVWFADKNAN